MSVDQHPYAFIYLLGCVLALILLVFNATLISLISWITKENVLEKNLKKLQLPDNISRGAKVFGLIIGAALEASLSWIGVLGGIWTTVVTVLKLVREAFTQTPEAIKLLRFPLRNNPDMSREAVWAYVHALGIRGGNNQPNADELLYSVNTMSEDFPFFDREAALNQLKDLNVVSSEVISSVHKYMEQFEEESEDEI